MREQFSVLRPLAASVLSLSLAAQEGGEPGVFLLPGTGSTLKIHGFVEVNGTYDLAGRTGDIDGGDWAAFLPSQPFDTGVSGKGAPVRNQLYLTARTSRLGFTFTTPSILGPVVAVLEGDFNSPSPCNFSSAATTNGTTFRIRKAYGQIGDFLAGLKDSTFSDNASLPDTVDFNGVPSGNATRQAMVAWTFHPSRRSTLAVAAEAPFDRQFLGCNGPIAGHGGDNPKVGFHETPNLVANYTYSHDWGHVSLRGVSVPYLDNGDGTGAMNHRAHGYGAALSGHFNLGEDSFVWSVQGGEGIGRFMASTLTQGGADDGRAIRLWKAVGCHAGYTRVWNSRFRSTLAYSRTTIADPGTSPGGGGTLNDYLQSHFQYPDELQPNRSVDNLLANVFWTPLPTFHVGLEYSYGRRTTFNTWNNVGDHTFISEDPNVGTQRRINLVCRFTFY